MKTAKTQYKKYSFMPHPFSSLEVFPIISGEARSLGSVEIVWWVYPIILAFGKVRRKNREFEDSPVT